jgi:hypothetical protein
MCAVFLVVFLTQLLYDIENLILCVLFLVVGARLIKLCESEMLSNYLSRRIHSIVRTMRLLAICCFAEFVGHGNQ